MALIEHLLGILLASFWFSSVLVCIWKHIQNYYSLVLWPPPRFLLHTLERKVNYVGSPPVTTDDMVALMPLGMV